MGGLTGQSVEDAGGLGGGGGLIDGCCLSVGDEIIPEDDI